jgi:hypothetical protein
MNITFNACGVKHEDSDCGRFHAGKFIYVSKSDGSVYTVIRNDSVQVETNKANGRVIRSKIKWTNPCEFRLEYLDRNFKGDDSLLAFIQAHPLHVTILKANDDYCIFSASVENMEKVIIDTLKVLH